MPIQLLPTQLANQIAAGEVVERPASVIKELVENSLDAGATDIVVDIEKGGSRRMLIRDNGKGIPQEELTLALSRHATSKISSLDDLEAIMSLGFRGEALASISSVSRLRLVSRTAEQESAFSAFCEGRDMAVVVEPSAHPIGTSVDVEDLFFNTPARRKFLRTDKTEFGHIEEVVRRIALAYPNVSFRLNHNGQSVRHYPALREQADPLTRIGRIVGKRFAEEAIYLEQSYGDLKLYGWLSPPDVCRHQNDVQYFYVNDRMMRDRLLNHAVRQAYGEQLPEDRQPSFVLYFTLPARDVDVNVHPAKHEVRFHQSRQVHDFVFTTLRDALAQYAGEAPDMAHESPQHHYRAPDPSQYVAPQGQRAMSPVGRPSSGAGPVSRVAADSWQKMLATPAAAEGAGAMATTADSTDWQPVYVLNTDWVLLAKGEQLGLVKQAELQAAVVRDKLALALQTGLSGQPLLLPTQVAIPDVATTLAKYESHLSRLGVQLKRVNNDQCAIVQVPAILRRTAVAETVPALLACLAQQPENLSIDERPDVVDWLAQQGVEPMKSERVQQYWQQLAPTQRPTIFPLDWQQALT
ncbi:DNA mismatch repair protein MutL [Aliidiomarina taiwanensis]|uniref:DNA mismatch repair protein MutL n=1 Tax=Aliidiomarina taiwanensis TaxID=946228 RepID=A0A432X7D6_9GAMM|nr:DNA mismatch repair endonuclease MutL [Aliidiomarina taiwanensis]RUO42784.1 DNA mismatch repair protein MutL [Aliidiomarina taiwanensis]